MYRIDSICNWGVKHFREKNTSSRYKCNIIEAHAINKNFDFIIAKCSYCFAKKEIKSFCLSQCEAKFYTDYREHTLNWGTILIWVKEVFWFIRGQSQQINALILSKKKRCQHNECLWQVSGCESYQWEAGSWCTLGCWR